MTAVHRFVPAGWRRAFAVAGVCLPVPLAAVTGLSLPLPAAVERLAAAFVPWVETAGLQANQALSRGAPGSIGAVIDEVAATVDEAAQPATVSQAVASTRPAVPIARADGVATLPPLAEPAADPSEAAPRREGEPASQQFPAPAAQSPAPEPAAHEPAPAPAPAPPAPAPTPTEPAPPPPATKGPEPTGPVVEVVEETVEAGGKVVDDVTTVVENTTGVQVPAVPPLPGLGK